MSKRSKAGSKPEPKVGEAITEELNDKDLAERAVEAERDCPVCPVEKPVINRNINETKKAKIEEEISEEADEQKLTNLDLEFSTILLATGLAGEHAKVAKENGFSSAASELSALHKIGEQLKKHPQYFVKKAKSV
jgi:hypothetical protein